MSFKIDLSSKILYSLNNASFRIFFIEKVNFFYNY